MGIAVTKLEPHWNYFLAIENDAVRLSRYIEFTDDNFETYSIELARVLIAAASEVDVVCKQLCRVADPGSHADGINAYRTELRPRYPAIATFDISIPRHGLQLRPWDEWKNPNGVPFWWTACNKVKHHRNTEYRRANVKNTLNALAGLFVMVLYLNRTQAEQGTLVPNPQILRTGDDHFGGTTHNGVEFGINYLL